MKFDAINRINNRKQATTPIIEEPANEANSKFTIDIPGESMKVAIVTDKMIEENHLQPVTDPIWLKNGREPTDGGLFSPIIFGETPQEKRRIHAYIDLHRKFFHPYIFEVLKKIYRGFEEIASGQGCWYVESSGELVRIKDQNDKRYNEDNTGLDWLIKNFKKIKFKETDSDTRKERLKLFNTLSDDEIFISKWVVIPIFYRDIDNSSGKMDIPPINTMYNELIKNCNSYEDEILQVSRNLTLAKIQNTLVQLRKFGQSLIELKKGAIQKTVLGKASDFGSRGVISVPSLNGCETPNDCIVDIIHSGIPISYCITAGYPFMIKWVTEFFEDMFRNKSSVPVYKKDKKGNYELEYVPISNQAEIFTKDFIDKKMTMYVKTFGAERFETVKVKCEDGVERALYFPGRNATHNPGKAEANTIGTRPLTWTDVFYLAAVNTLSDKYCYITRYPLEDYFGTFPSKVAVLSTIKTAPMIVNGEVYPHYPVIDLSLSKEDMGTQFIDTISLSNLYLEAIGGDYDGDTVSLKILFTLEANQEAAKAMENIKHYVTIQGNLIRILNNEPYLTFYNMTRKE